MEADAFPMRAPDSVPRVLREPSTMAERCDGCARDVLLMDNHNEVGVGMLLSNGRLNGLAVTRSHSKTSRSCS